MISRDRSNPHMWDTDWLLLRKLVGIICGETACASRMGQTLPGLVLKQVSDLDSYSHEIGRFLSGFPAIIMNLRGLKEDYITSLQMHMDDACIYRVESYLP